MAKNKKNKNGSWTLCGAYLAYRNEGGTFSPDIWNLRNRELDKENCKLQKMNYDIPLYFCENCQIWNDEPVCKKCGNTKLSHDSTY